jgi:hypothetical protein
MFASASAAMGMVFWEQQLRVKLGAVVLNCQPVARLQLFVCLAWLQELNVNTPGTQDPRAKEKPSSKAAIHSSIGF